MTEHKKSALTRAKLVQAAYQIVLSEGINQLTLEAVAYAAGVSKGGLLYHFPSKEALIEGMLDQYLDRFEQRLQSKQQDENSLQKLAWVRAYIRATFEPDPQENALSASLLAAVAINPELLKPMQARYDMWQKQFESSGEDPALATVIRLALDGLWVAEMFGLAAPQDDLRARVLAKLLELAKEKDP